MTMIPMRFLSNRPSFPFGPLCLGVVCLVGVAILLAGCARPQEVHEEASISNEFQNVDRGQNVDGEVVGFDLEPPRHVINSLDDENDWVLVDVNGTLHQPFSVPEVHSIVLLFLATDCPIANSYIPKLNRLAAYYRQRGVEFYSILSSPETDEHEARLHQQKFQVSFPVILDTDLKIADRVSAEVTPEAIVFSRFGKSPMYRGAIDNQNVDYGKRAPTSSSNYLEDALNAMIQGEAVEVQKTTSIGCFIRP